MRSYPAHSIFEIRILTLIKKHLDKELKQRDIQLTGGVHIKPKPKHIRVDVIELNTTGIDGTRITKTVTGLTNINYQDENYYKAESMARFISDLFQDTVINQIHFSAYSEREYQMYKNGPNLWVGNVSLIIKHKDYDGKYYR